MVYLNKSEKYFAFFFFVIFFANVNYVLNHLFVDGSGMQDVGWFVYLITSSTDFPASNPNMGLQGGSYFAVHISPFIYVTSFLYQLTGFFVSKHVFFAIFMGLAYSLMAVAVYIVMRHRFYSISDAIFFGALVAALPLNGVFLGSMGFPHFEVIIPSLILLVFALYHEGFRVTSILVFVFLLLIREDGGLHAALFFTILSVVYFFKDRKLKSWLLSFSVLGFVYSITVIVLQKIYLNDDNAFERIYSGNPFYDHLTLSFLKSRVVFFVSHREYLWAPWVIAVIAALMFRNVLMLVGVIFSIPWVILSLSAISPMTHTMSNYYAFPLAISCVWPIMAFFIDEKNTNNKERYGRFYFFVAASAPILSMLLFDGHEHVDSKPWRDVDFEYVKVISKTQDVVGGICNQKHLMGNVLIDESVSALMPGCLARISHSAPTTFADQAW